MQTIQPVKRGGRRVGAGRKHGYGRYGEPTVPVRVPLSLLEVVGSVDGLLRKAKRKLPLYGMQSFNRQGQKKSERIS
jgi:hypothetical protein